MKVTVERGCGLDVHKASVVACVMVPEQPPRIRKFGTTTAELLRLGDWLGEERVTDVAMESTGSYWKPLFNVLEAQGLELTLVNPAHMKAYQRSKTDVKDAEWIADLLKHGLLAGSRVANRAGRELQELVRYRGSLVGERGDAVRRIHKILEGANIKLGSVASDIVGKSGREMLRALASGEARASELASLARGRMKQKQVDLELALDGLMGAHQRFMIEHLLNHLETLDREIGELVVEIEERMRPLVAVVSRMVRLEGVGEMSAWRILAEIGTDMSHWRSAKAFCSWSKICPGNHESAGKAKSTSIGHGRGNLQSVLIECARSAVRVRGSQFAEQYHRLKPRLGANRAIVAVAHSMATIIYCMLRDGTCYQPRSRAEQERNVEAIAQAKVRSLQRLGFNVTIEPAA